MAGEKKLLGPDGEAIDVTPDMIEDAMPSAGELVVRDPDDRYEVAQVLDQHDVAQILMLAQQQLIKKSLYDFPQGGERIVDLSLEGVNEVVRLMNSTGKMRAAIDPNSLKIEREVQDGVPMIVATVYAHDPISGFGFFGTSSEPERMKLTDAKANQRRQDGKVVADDNTIFDVFARAKATGKAQRNALKRFVPEEVRQTLIAQYLGDSRRIERVQTVSEVKALEAAPPLTDPVAVELRERCDALYAEIRELAGGRGKAALTPATYQAYMLQSQGAMDTLERMVRWLEERKEAIPLELAAQDRQAMALETATQVACPKCEEPAKRYCKGIRGSHPERVAARLEQIPMPELPA